MGGESNPKSSGTSRKVLSYFWGAGILTLSHFISFPILTRLLSISDYGAFALINSTLVAIYPVAKMGVQNSIVRFYQEYRQGGESKERIFFSTYLFSMVGFGFFFLVLVVLLVPFITRHVLNTEGGRAFYWASLLIPAHCFVSTIYNFFLARQDPLKFNLANIFASYVPFAFAFSFLFWKKGALEWYFIGVVIGNVVYAIFYGNYARTVYRISIRLISKDLLGKALLYGTPLMIFELTSNLLSYSDRYLIGYYLTPADLAVYAVGYNVAMFITNLLTLPVINAIEAKYVEIWTIRGKEATEFFLSKVLKGVMAILFLVGFVSAVMFQDLITLLASMKYLGASVIAPYIIASLFIFCCYPIYGAGLYLAKKTRTLLYCIVAGLLLNVALNVVLIPQKGIVGAAIANLASYALASGLIYRFSRFHVRISIPFRSVAIFSLCGIATYFILTQIELGYRVANIMVKGITGVLVYTTGVFLLEKDIAADAKAALLGIYRKQYSV